MQVTALKDNHIKLICCGSNHTVAMDKDGTIFTFGRNEFAQVRLVTVCFCIQMGRGSKV
jgi:alpha-tubulin suppressor-like RCC1 family protein